MHNFTYYTPTKVVFGKNAEAQVGELVKAQDCRNTLITISHSLTSGWHSSDLIYNRKITSLRDQYTSGPAGLS